MSSSGNLRLAFVIEAIDRSTKVVRAISKSVDKLTEPAKRVGEAYSRVAGVMAGIGRSMLVVGAAAGSSLFGLKRVADSVDVINDTAAALGITTQLFQRMGYAADQSGSSSAEMAQALVFLNKNMGEARAGNQELITWFARVGVTMRDLRNPTFRAADSIHRMSDTFHRVGDAGNNAGRKIEATTTLMGRSGFRMIQMMNGGSQALKDLYAEADRLNIVLSNDTVKAMTSFNDGWGRLRLTVFAAVATISAKAAPAIQDVIDRITRWTGKNRDLVAGRVGEFVERVVAGLPAFVEGVKGVTAAIVKLVAASDRVAQTLGGWPNLLALIAGYMSAKLTLAVYGLVAALGLLNAAAWANPLTWVLAAVVALTAAIPLLVLHWDKLIEKLYQLNEALPAWLKNGVTGRLLEGISGPRSGPKPEGSWEPAPEGSWETSPRLKHQRNNLIGARERIDIGGTLNIRVNGQGLPVVDLVKKAPGSPMDFDVYSGPNMSW